MIPNQKKLRLFSINCENKLFLLKSDHFRDICKIDESNDWDYNILYYGQYSVIFWKYVNASSSSSISKQEILTACKTECDSIN